jgi:hypothetical protein
MDFRKSEFTNFSELIKKTPRLKLLGKRDVVLIRNLQGDQIIFIHGFYVVKDELRNKDVRFLRSERIRLMNGATWNPLMVKDYAKQVGLNLENLLSFEEHLERIVGPMYRQWLKDYKKQRKAA